MSNSLVPVRRNRASTPVPQLSGLMSTPGDRVQAFQQQAISDSTRRNYQRDWLVFEAWCTSRGRDFLPAEPRTVAEYVAEHANLVDETGRWFYAPGTIETWVAAINKAHEAARLSKPGSHSDVTLTMAGIRRAHSRPKARKAPLLLPDLSTAIRAIDLRTWPNAVIGYRDWAMMLFGFVGAYRRSEVASLLLVDVRPHSEDGLHITLRSSKTDQEAEGMVKGLPFGANPWTCAPCAFHRWTQVLVASDKPRATRMRQVYEAAKTLDTHVCRTPSPTLPSSVNHDHLFRPVMKNAAIKDRALNGQAVNDTVHRRLAAIGVDPTLYGAHSLRAGFVTQAFRAGATHHEVMRQTGHKSVGTVEEYSRESAPLLHNAVSKLNL